MSVVLAGWSSYLQSRVTWTLCEQVNSPLPNNDQETKVTVNNKDGHSCSFKMLGGQIN